MSRSGNAPGGILFYNIRMYIHAKVIAGARKEEIAKIKKDHFKISVKEPAERNLANKRVVELLADYFKLKPNQVRIINGHQSPSKLLAVDIDIMI